jgi:GntR family transcriptional regulator of vanillate catabolism
MSERPPRAARTLETVLRLRQLILDGELRPAERIAEIPLGERLGVSRTPLRLALAQLDHEGLVEALPSGGFAVRSFTREDIADAIELRGVLEGTAARFAAERLEDVRELEALHGCVAQLDALVRPDRPVIDSLERYAELNDRFHELLVAQAKSPLLAAELERVGGLPFASPTAFVRVQAELEASHVILYVAQQQHRGMLEAIEAREGTRAEALAREHARIARRNLDIALTRPEAMERMPGGRLITLHEAEAAG